MRTAFVEALVEAAEHDPRIWLLTGDLGYSVLEKFAGKFPDRFINVGIAEQNMVGVAAGLAMTGKIVFTYSIANFSTLRCLEQIRNDVCYHNLPVIIVAVGGGLAYGSLGYSHHAVEDLAIMRSLPNLSVVAPADPHETRACVKSLIRAGSPAYLRIGKANEPCIHLSEPVVQQGESIRVRNGSDISFISTGGTLGLVIEAAESLAEFGFEAEVLSLPYVAPLSKDSVFALGARTGKIVTIEEHGRGGLGSAIAEGLCSSGSRARMVPVTLNGGSCGTAGSQEFLRSQQGLTVGAILGAARSALADGP